MKRKKILVSVTNDLTNDQRVHKICSSLQSEGYDVLLIGRRLSNSKSISERKYQTKRFRLVFNKGFMFYLNINIRFLFFMLFYKTDIFLANDLDTLSCNAIAAKLKSKKLVYDSHELFTETPELIEKHFKKRIWTLIEKTFIRQANYSYTVCESISNHYNRKYNINMGVIRNLPITRTNQTEYSSRKNIMVYQGALNKDRGLELLINSMSFIKDYKLIILGKGDIEKDLKELSKKLNLDERVIFTGNLDFDELYKVTNSAKIGFSIEQGKSLNYYYALPNKIFDYIQAGVPFICSDFPEMKNIVDTYNVGETIGKLDAKRLSIHLTSLLKDSEKLNRYHENCKIAAKELNWEKEKTLLIDIFNKL